MRTIIRCALGLMVTSLVGCASFGMKQQSTLRVMTYNIHHGEGTDGKVDLERIAKLITDNNVDLVALQEVDRNTQRTGRRDMPAELARLTGLTNYVFGANIPLQGGEYGNAILSRFPILNWTNHFLPQIVPGEQRGVLEATINWNDEKISFCSTHLDHRREEGDRIASVTRIGEIFGERLEVMIIAGDFNAQPESQPYLQMRSRFRDAWPSDGVPGYTIPSESPRSRIDYIWVQWLETVDATVEQSNASDHLPVIINLQRHGCLPAPPPNPEFVDIRRRLYE